MSRLRGVGRAAGKALGRSVRELLGGHRDKLPIISIGGYYKDGMIDVPREPGFCVRLDRKAVEKYRVV
ncbi:MAG: hypothetical protein HY323_01610 [Betaproteobacteria bacterium]|nr:hypothetical protein [Betaproteobacteria bacterium]